MSLDRYSCCSDLPPGTYNARVEKSRVVHSFATKNVGVSVYWKIFGGFRDRLVWTTLWLSPRALPRSKRDLAKLGVHALESLDNDPPVPPGALCRLKIAEQITATGAHELRIVRWDVLPAPTTVKEAANHERI